MNWLLMARLNNGRPEYDQMQELALKSYRRHLAGEWTVGISAASEWQEMWRTLFHDAHALCLAGHNVFIVGSDTMAVQPIEVFGKYHQMMMFWHTDPVSRDGYPQFLNAEIIYLPAELPVPIWQIGLDRFDSLDPNCYDHSQRIWNDMFWAQQPPPELDPTMHYAPGVVWSPISDRQAKIIHFHASRNIQETLAHMQGLSQ